MADACTFCDHLAHEALCTVETNEHLSWLPDELKQCACDGKDHWYFHDDRWCKEDTTTWSMDWNAGCEFPDYSYCGSPTVKGFDRCWIHLSTENRATYRASKSQEVA